MAVGIAVVGLLSACGNGGHGNSSGVAIGRSPAALSPSGLHCKLPVVGHQAGASLGGFLDIPSGRLTPDPAVQVSYDWTARKWLPVDWTQVSPDGSSYVYSREATPSLQQNEIHVVDVSTGADRVVYRQGAYHVVAYQPEGIYVDHHLSGTDASSGLWLLDPSSGSLKPYVSAQQGTWDRIANGGAWSYSPTGNRFGSNVLARLDLATGSIATWLTLSSPEPPQPGSKSIRVLGFDRSTVLVQIYSFDGSSQVWKVTSPGGASRLPDLPLGVMSPPATVTDAHGTWLIGADNGVYLYQGTAFRRVAGVQSSEQFSVAGACN